VDLGETRKQVRCRLAAQGKHATDIHQLLEIRLKRNPRLGDCSLRLGTAPHNN
jgi:hypothetical protein